MKGLWFPGHVWPLCDGPSLPALTRCWLYCLGKSAWGSRMHHGFRLTSRHYLVIGVMGNSLSYPGTDSGTPSCYHALWWPIRKWHKYPHYSVFYFSSLGSTFLFCFCWQQVTNHSALAPHILLGKVCLCPSENQAKDVPVCQCFFLLPQWCCLGQEIILFGTWQEGRLLLSCLRWMSTSRWALHQQGQMLWESVFTQI